MKKFYFFLLAIVFILPSTSVFSQEDCSETLNFNWKNVSNVGFVWPISNGETTITRNYSIAGTTGTANVAITLNNPNGKNIDMSNCGTAGNHFYTATHSDPNASYNCGPGANGQFSYGPEYLTLGMTSATSNDIVSITFEFSHPTRISGLDIWDIDYQGGAGAGSWEDEIDVSAKIFNLAVPVKATSSGAGVIVTGNNTTALNLRSLYGAGSGNLAHTDPTGSVQLATDVLVTTLTITYSNGPNDDGISDDHAIKIGGFQFCPNFLYIPLPVKLTSFSGQKSNSDVNLEWEAVREEDFNAFQVEYSENGLNYTVLTSVEAKGNLGAITRYNYKHSGILSSSNGVHSYRLKLVDTDGSFVYSKVVVIRNTVLAIDELKVFPNPIRTGENIGIEATAIRSIVMYNAAGLIVFKNQYNNVSSVVIPSNQLKSKGLFMISVNGKPAKKIIVN